MSVWHYSNDAYLKRAWFYLNPVPSCTTHTLAAPVNESVAPTAQGVCEWNRPRSMTRPERIHCLEP